MFSMKGMFSCFAVASLLALYHIGNMQARSDWFSVCCVFAERLHEGSSLQVFLVFAFAKQSLLATFFLIFSAVTMAKGPQFHETPKEIDMMMRRREIRQRLQQEFNRVMYNPYRIAHHIEIVSWRTHFPNLYLAEPILW